MFADTAEEVLLPATGGERHADNLARIATGAAFYRPVMTCQGVTTRLLRSPIFANWLAGALKIRPDQAEAYAGRLEELATATQDAEFVRDVAAYLKAVRKPKR